MDAREQVSGTPRPCERRGRADPRVLPTPRTRLDGDHSCGTCFCRGAAPPRDSVAGAAEGVRRADTVSGWKGDSRQPLGLGIAGGLNRVRIAYLVAFDPYASNLGTEIGLRGVAEGMAARGHTVTIFYAYARGEGGRSPEGVRVTGVSNTGLRLIAGLEANHRILRVCRGEDAGHFDVVDLFGSALGLAFSRLRSEGAKRVYHAVDLAMLEWAALDAGRVTRFPFYAGLAFGERRAMHAAQLVVAVSKGTRADLAVEYPYSDAPIEVVPLPLTESWFDPNPPVERGHFLYIAAGHRRLTELFLRALARAQQMGANAKGIVLREPRPEYSRLAQSLGIDVTFRSNVSADVLRDCYAGAYAYVLPSRREGLGLPVIEAATQATPTISSPLPSVLDFVVDGRNGLLVAGEDVETWAEKMYLLATGSDLQRALGAEARRNSEAYRASRVAATLEALYAGGGG